MSLIYDSNVLIDAVRFSQNDQKKFLKLINPKNEKVYISIVTLAEVRSFAIQAGWGNKRKNELELLINDLSVISIDDSTIEAYIEIDVFAQGKHPTIPLTTIAKDGKVLKGSPLNLGKNDIWIAATAYLFDCQLVTADNDFDPLNGTFIRLIKIEKDEQGKIIL